MKTQFRVHSGICLSIFGQTRVSLENPLLFFSCFITSLDGQNICKTYELILRKSGQQHEDQWTETKTQGRINMEEFIEPFLPRVQKLKNKLTSFKFQDQISIYGIITMILIHSHNQILTNLLHKNQYSYAKYIPLVVF